MTLSLVILITIAVVCITVLAVALGTYLGSENQTPTPPTPDVPDYEIDFTYTFGNSWQPPTDTAKIYIGNDSVSGTIQWDATDPDSIQELAGLADVEGYISYTFDSGTADITRVGKITVSPESSFPTLAFGFIHANIDGDNIKLGQNLNIFTCKIGKDVPLKNLSLVNSTNLTSFPTLPSNLESFYCSGTTFTSLPTLPNSLIRLQCDGMSNLVNLPNSLPESLLYLECSTTPLTSLPTLPNSLKEIACAFTPLTSLPTLPDSLIGLFCANTFITSLPNIPSSIRAIDMRNNGMTDSDADTILTNIISKPVHGTVGNYLQILQQGSTTLTIDTDLANEITTPPFYWSIL